MDTETGCLRVQMLGGFSLRYAGKELHIESNRNTKVFRLLQMLLEAGEDGLSGAEILEGLFSSVRPEEGMSTLRVTVSSLRGVLKKCGLPEENYIRNRRWRYYFVAPFPVETDAGRLKKIVAGLEEAPAGDLREQLEEACSLYKGHFLPELEGDVWAEHVRRLYQDRHRMCLKALSVLLEEGGEWHSLEKLSAEAASLYPLEGWQEIRMKSLLRMEEYQEAFRVYRETERLYSEEEPWPMPGYLEENLRRMGSLVEMDHGNIEEILKELREPGRPEGAYRCGYPAFLDCCHAASRLMEYTGESVYVVLCSLEKLPGKLQAGMDDPEETAQRLAEAIRLTLGREAVYARYSREQFLLLLPGVCREECPALIRRIEARFQGKEPRKRYCLKSREMSLGTMDMMEISLIS